MSGRRLEPEIIDGIPPTNSVLLLMSTVQQCTGVRRGVGFHSVSYRTVDVVPPVVSLCWLHWLHCAVPLLIPLLVAPITIPTSLQHHLPLCSAFARYDSQCTEWLWDSTAQGKQLRVESAKSEDILQTHNCTSLSQPHLS